jgi:antitoxin ParD1/3/4
LVRSPKSNYQKLPVIDILGSLYYMNVHLGSVFDEFVADLLKGGQYQSQSEVLREGLRMLKEREEMKQIRLNALRKEIAAGIEQADQGQFVDGPEAFARIRNRSRR